MATKEIVIVPGHKVRFKMAGGTRQGIVIEVRRYSATVREYHDNGIHRTHTLPLTQLFDPR